MRHEIRETLQSYLERANKYGLNGVDFDLTVAELEELMSGLISELEGEL